MLTFLHRTHSPSGHGGEEPSVPGMENPRHLTLIDLAERVDQLAAEAFEADHSAATVILSRMASLLRALDTTSAPPSVQSRHPAILREDSRTAMVAS